MLLEVKLLVTMQDKTSKDTFCLIHFIFQSNLDLIISRQQMKNVTRGRGGQKVQKSVTYYLNCPLGVRRPVNFL
jgi:hypothetical protein